MKGFVKALKNGTEYDYIANHGWNMSKDDLSTILKEYIFHLDKMCIYENKEDVKNSVYDSLLDYVLEE